MILAADPISAKTGIPSQYFVYASLAIIVLTLVFTMIVAKNSSHGWGAMQYPQLVLGMLAIFTYVGTEVTIQSNLGSLLKTRLSSDHLKNRRLLPLYHCIGAV